MKTPTVDDPKPKRDRLGPTGPANLSDDDTKKGRDSNRTDSASAGEPSYERDIENILGLAMARA